MSVDGEAGGVADELYGLDPDEFMAARTAAVATAKTAGDKAGATAIGKLRRPTRSAWAVNLLSRYAAAELTELLELGDALAAAQESLSGPELRRLSTQRNQVVDAVARKAVKLAAERDQALAEATRTEIATTLQAALADPDVRALVTAGRVDKAQTYSGFGLGLATGTVATTAKAAKAEPAAAAAAAAAAAKKTKRKAGDAGPDPDAEQAELLAAVEAAQAAVAEAEQATESAAAQLEQTTTGVAAATERVDAASQDVADLRAELRQAEEAENAARRAATEAADAQHDATTAQQQTTKNLAEAQRVLRDLLAT